jgi:hypothetical protein
LGHVAARTALVAVAAVFAVAALVLLMSLDIGVDAHIPRGAVVEQPAGRR